GDGLVAQDVADQRRALHFAPRPPRGAGTAWPARSSGPRLAKSSIVSAREAGVYPIASETQPPLNPSVVPHGRPPDPLQGSLATKDRQAPKEVAAESLEHGLQGS